MYISTSVRMIIRMLEPQAMMLKVSVLTWSPIRLRRLIRCRARNLFARPDLFPAEKKEIRVAAGARIDDGGNVSGEIGPVPPAVIQRKSKGDLQRDLWHADGFAVCPELAVNRDLPTGGNGIQERLAVGSKDRVERYDAWKQLSAFPIGSGDLIDSNRFSKRLDAQQVAAAGIDIGNYRAPVN